MKCAADPGKFKTGFALTDDEGNLLFSAIIPAAGQSMLAEIFETKSLAKLSFFKCEGSVPEKFETNEIFVGNGTTHSNLQKILEDKTQIILVNEYGTTLEGRKLYWKLHPPCGFWKLFPTSLRLPPRDIDDLAAWAIILKNLESK